MKKIKIEMDEGEITSDIGANWFPFLDFLATRGIHPKLGNYPENPKIFQGSMNGYQCYFQSSDETETLTLKELKEKFDFHKYVYFGKDALDASIYDMRNSLFFYLNLIIEEDDE